MKRGSSYGSNGNEEHKRPKTHIDEADRIPRKVLHLRGFHDDIQASDIVQFAIPFGKMRNMVFAKKTHQALLEMEDLDEAIKMVDYYNKRSAQFDNKTVYIQYSKYDEIDKELKTQHVNVVKAITSANSLIDSNSEESPSCVLRVFIDNKMYPVTLQALKQIFSKKGEVLKIVTFVKNTVWQALIQMADEVAAHVAKNSLNGKNIYDGCCTLRVEFSRQESIHIKYNNDKSFDFTNPNLPQGDSPAPPNPFDSPPPALMDPMHGNNNVRHAMDFHDNPLINSNNTNSNMNIDNIASITNLHNLNQLPTLENLQHAIGNLTKLAQLVSTNQPSITPAPFHHDPFNRDQHQMELPPSLMNLPPPRGLHLGGNMYPGNHHGINHHGQHGGNQYGGGGGEGGKVILVSNFNQERVVADTLFILFGVYGNVQKVKILFNKKDSALVEFEEEYQARDALENLKGIVWHDKPLNIVFSKFLTVKLPKDGSDEPWLTKDFSGSKLHRFRKFNSKNHRNIFPPSPTLHLSNIPSSVTEEYLTEQFTNFGQILSFKFSPNDKKIAWIKMDSIQSALEALVNMHNHELTPTSHLRVSFTGYTL